MQPFSSNQVFAIDRILVSESLVMYYRDLALESFRRRYSFGNMRAFCDRLRKYYPSQNLFRLRKPSPSKKYGAQNLGRLRKTSYAEKNSGSVFLQHSLFPTNQVFPINRNFVSESLVMNYRVFALERVFGNR